MKTQIRKPFVPRTRKGISFPTTGKTKQSARQECDINFIINRYSKTGYLPGRTTTAMDYGEAITTDFHEAMNVVAKANESFASLPANVRKRFGHDPSNMMEFIQDPENKNEAIKLGLIDKPIEKPGTKGGAPKEPIPKKQSETGESDPAPAEN